MSVQIALDKKTHDIIKLSGGGIARVSDGRYTVQLVKNRLLTKLGEWLLDPTLGFMNLDDFEKNVDLFDLEMRAKKIILDTVGVQTIDTFDIVLEKDRTLLITFTAKTVYGEIDLTVPWS